VSANYGVLDASNQAMGGAVITDRAGTILSLDTDACRLLNIANRRKVRHLTNFFENCRIELLHALQRVSDGAAPTHFRLTLRPRERRPVQVSVALTAHGPDVQWHFRVGELS
jgi:hypothetical protein